jgi:hypothetical protein
MSDDQGHPAVLYSEIAIQYSTVLPGAPVTENVPSSHILCGGRGPQDPQMGGAKKNPNPVTSRATSLHWTQARPTDNHDRRHHELDSRQQSTSLNCDPRPTDSSTDGTNAERAHAVPTVRPRIRVHPNFLIFFMKGETNSRALFEVQYVLVHYVFDSLSKRRIIQRGI